MSWEQDNAGKINVFFHMSPRCCRRGEYTHGCILEGIGFLSYFINIIAYA